VRETRAKAIAHHCIYSGKGRKEWGRDS